MINSRSLWNNNPLFNKKNKSKMKTQSRVEITPEYCEYIPDKFDLKENVVYISINHSVSVHLCLCGCGNKSVLPINTNIGWSLTEQNGKISFTPSILNTNCPNQAHYVITNNIANIL